MRDCLQDRRIQWFGQLERMEENAWFSKYRTFMVRCSFPRIWLSKTLKKLIRSGLKERKVRKNLAKDRNAWNCKSFIKNCPTHASMQNICENRM